MLHRIILSIVVAVAVGILCVILGTLLMALNVNPAVALGALLKELAALIGILAGLVYYLTGRL